MKNRFIRRARLKSNIHLQKAPVIIVAGALYLDKEALSNVIQLKIKNISASIIDRLTVCLSVSDDKVEKSTTHVYGALNALPGCLIGNGVAIQVPMHNAKSFSILSISVDYSDGSSWSSTGEWKPLPSQYKIKETFSYYEQLSYARRFGKKSRMIVKDYDGFWLCACSMPNSSSETFCSECKNEKDKLRSIDRALLQEEGMVMVAKKMAGDSRRSEWMAALDLLSNVQKPELEEAKRQVLKQLHANIEAQNKKSSSIRNLLWTLIVCLIAAAIATAVYLAAQFPDAFGI